MDDYLLSGENIIETKDANFLLSLDENELRQFGVFGVDAEMRLLGLGEGRESIGGKLYLTNFRLFSIRTASIGLQVLKAFFCRRLSRLKTVRA